MDDKNEISKMKEILSRKNLDIDDQKELNLKDT